ncbi:hypothetical protein ACFMQL_05160 [Nonomuraea fastidiosa]|jgi:hypothetical protein|uniref:hypothetical protein n=1 Tax=Nonomuraea TaxID=83681 RepID=UPI00324B91A1
MGRRIGRGAAVCGALGAWWWASVRLAWAGVGCGDWGCLVPAIGVVAAISLALLAVAAYALDGADVRPGRRVALVAAGMYVVFRLAAEPLPSWTSTLAHLAATGAMFAGAGALAAYVTEPRTSRGGRIAAIAGVIALLPAALAITLTLYDL